MSRRPPVRRRLHRWEPSFSGTDPRPRRRGAEPARPPPPHSERIHLPPQSAGRLTPGARLWRLRLPFLRPPGVAPKSSAGRYLSRRHLRPPRAEPRFSGPSPDRRSLHLRQKPAGPRFLEAHPSQRSRNRPRPAGRRFSGAPRLHHSGLRRHPSPPAPRSSEVRQSWLSRNRHRPPAGRKFSEARRFRPRCRPPPPPARHRFLAPRAQTRLSRNRCLAPGLPPATRMSGSLGLQRLPRPPP
jgi:hypothetical protein